MPEHNHCLIYNLEKYVRECLDSVLKQELEDYEIDLWIII